MMFLAITTLYGPGLHRHGRLEPPRISSVADADCRIDSSPHYLPGGDVDQTVASNAEPQCLAASEAHGELEEAATCCRTHPLLLGHAILNFRLHRSDNLCRVVPAVMWRTRGGAVQCAQSSDTTRATHHDRYRDTLHREAGVETWDRASTRHHRRLWGHLARADSR